MRIKKVILTFANEYCWNECSLPVAISLADGDVSNASIHDSLKPGTTIWPTYLRQPFVARTHERSLARERCYFEVLIYIDTYVPVRRATCVQVDSYGTFVSRILIVNYFHAGKNSSRIVDENSYWKTRLVTQIYTRLYTFIHEEDVFSKI